MACYNIWAFIIKQKKYKTLPLLVFYVLVVLLTLMRIYFAVWALEEYPKNWIFAFELMPIIKVNLGLI